MKFKTKHLLPVMALVSGHCEAFDWLFEPNFRADERYTDNVTMQANSASVIDSMITTLSPGIVLGIQTENQELESRFKWNELIYHNASYLDFSEKLLDIKHQFTGERFKTSLDAGYHEQSSINTQLVDPTLNVTSRTLVPRLTYSIAPSITFFLTEKNSLKLDYSYQKVNFDRPSSLQGLQFSDYTSQQFSSTLTHAFSERLSFNLVGAYSIFESSANFPENRLFSRNYSQKSNTIFYQGGLQYAFDELTQISLSAGMRNSDNNTRQQRYLTEFPDIASPETKLSSKASGHVFSAGLSRKADWGYVNLHADQQLSPSSSGSQQQTTSFSGQIFYNIGERWTGGLSADYRIADYTSVFNSSSVSRSTTYATLSPNIRWRWTPEINVQLSYTYASREFTSIHQTSIGNTVQLLFSYQPQINRQVK